MFWTQLAAALIALAALALAFAALKRSTSGGGDREQALEAARGRQWAELKETLDSLPGRIADETSASPLREAVEGVRDQLKGVSELLESSKAREAERLERLLAEIVRSQGAATTALTQGLEQLARQQEKASAPQAAVVEGLASVARAVRESDPAPAISAALESTLGAGLRDLARDIGSVREAVVAQAPALESGARSGVESVASGLRGLETSLGQVLEELRAVRQTEPRAILAELGRIAGLVESVSSQAGTSEIESRLASLESAVKAAFAGLPGQLASSLDGIASEGNSACDRVVGGLADMGTRLESVLRDGATETGMVRLELASVAERLEPALRELPVRIATEHAARPAPLPELEELAIAVRESGHLRGDVGRQVADAVSRVSHELSESARATEEGRQEAAQSLQAGLDRLEALSGAIAQATAPLADALSGHGNLIKPLSEAIEASRDRLEEASSTQRANQVEFAASVEVFSRSAQELSSGLSAFAREGSLDASDDPKAIQKALLESLDRLLGGFAESLKALLSESDLRTRETLAELAARLPGQA